MLIAGEHRTAEADGGSRQVVDIHLGGDDIGPVRSGRDQVGRAAGAVAANRHGLPNQTQFGQLGHQCPDGGAIEAEALGQIGARLLAVEVHLLEYPSEVVLANLVRTGGTGPSHALSTGGGIRYPSPLAPERRRANASTVAASSSTAPVTTYWTADPLLP